MSTLGFDGYKVRPAHAGDRQLLQQFIDADPYHAGRDAQVHLSGCAGEDMWAVEDEQGVVKMYFKTKTACRVSVYFGESKSDEQRQEFRDILASGIQWLAETLTANKFREMLINTESLALRIFCIDNLGFKSYRDDLVRPLPPTQRQE